jgi:hypothetical protein
MKRTPDEPKLVGAIEAAELLGVRQTNLRVVRGLPEPYQKLRSGTLYREDEIRALAWSRLNRKVQRPHRPGPITHTALEESAA